MLELLYRKSTPVKWMANEREDGYPREADGSNDPALDFLSLSFDPVKVLQTPPSKLSIPHPTVQPCDNLHTYTSGDLHSFP